MKHLIIAALRLPLAFGFAAPAFAQTAADSPELYPGEKALYEAAAKEGIVVVRHRPDLGQLGGAVQRLQEALSGRQIVYNDLGSAATVIALEKASNRPQADTAYYFAASADDAAAKKSWRRSSR